MLTPEQLAEIRARADAATPGPWGASEDGFEVSAKAALGDVLDEIIVAEVYHGPENADFIAHARADVPALLDEIDQLRAYADKLAAALPEGGLPQDIETRRRANQALAQENFELRAENKLMRERLRRAGEQFNKANAAVDENVRLRAENDRLRKQVARLREVMGRVEWIEADGTPEYCPWCEAYAVYDLNKPATQYVHEPDCVRQAVLAETAAS